MQLKKIKILYKGIVIFLITMLFSCGNNTQEVRDFLANKNLPIGIAQNAYHVYKDSGTISSKLITPLMLDYSNRVAHPYSEFPKGIKIINFRKKGIDSVTITGNYAKNYGATAISEIRGNVIVVNHTDKSKLQTEELYWDERNRYFISEKKFMLTTNDLDTIEGIGFESKDDLTKHLARKTIGRIKTKEE